MNKPGFINLSIKIPDKIYPIGFDQLYFKKPNINKILLEVFIEARNLKTCIEENNIFDHQKYKPKYKLKYIMDKIDDIMNKDDFSIIVKEPFFPISTIDHNGFYPMKINQLYSQKYNINKILILYNMNQKYGFINGLTKIAIGSRFNIHIKSQHKYFLLKYCVNYYGSLIQANIQQIKKLNDPVICLVKKYYYIINSDYDSDTEADSNFNYDLELYSESNTDNNTDTDTDTK